MLYLRLLLAVVFLGFAAYFVFMRFWTGRGEPVNSEFVKTLRLVAAVWIVTALIHGFALVFIAEDNNALVIWCSMNMMLASPISLFPYSRKALRFLVWSAVIISTSLLIADLLTLIIHGFSPEILARISAVVAMLAGGVYAFMALVAAPSFIKPKPKTVEPKA
jgi:hypothetical protein